MFCSTRPKSILKQQQNQKRKMPFFEYLINLPLRHPKTIQFLIHSYYSMFTNKTMIYETTDSILYINTSEESLEYYYLELILKVFHFGNKELTAFIEYLTQKLSNANCEIYDFF